MPNGLNPVVPLRHTRVFMSNDTMPGTAFAPGLFGSV